MGWGDGAELDLDGNVGCAVARDVPKSHARGRVGKADVAFTIEQNEAGSAHEGALKPRTDPDKCHRLN